MGHGKSFYMHYLESWEDNEDSKIYLRKGRWNAPKFNENSKDIDWKSTVILKQDKISPEGGHGNPLQYSCLDNPHGQRNLVGYNPWCLKESDMTKQLSTWLKIKYKKKKKKEYAIIKL